MTFQTKTKKIHSEFFNFHSKIAFHVIMNIDWRFLYTSDNRKKVRKTGMENLKNLKNREPSNKIFFFLCYSLWLIILYLILFLFSSTWPHSKWITGRITKKLNAQHLPYRDRDMLIIRYWNDSFGECATEWWLMRK